MQRKLQGMKYESMFLLLPLGVVKSYILDLSDNKLVDLSNVGHCSMLLIIGYQIYS